MNKTLFLITELQRPVGGLYSYATEMLPAWREVVNGGKARTEPFVLSLKYPNVPQGDLVETAVPQLREAAGKVGVRIYEAVRGGEKCFFIDCPMDDKQRNELHHKLWEKYRIKSDKAAGWEFYSVLSSFWFYAPLVAKALQDSGMDFACIDSQDWLAFPAGFECREVLRKPLACRFHSGEFGRALGKPDPDSPQLLIERAALQEADFIQGVSIHEAKFELYNLLQLKQELFHELMPSRSRKWAEEQEWKTNQYDQFLLLESEELDLVTQCAGGIPNGIILSPWLQLKGSDISEGRGILEKLLPGREKYVLFVGRAEYRKGIDALIQSFASINNPAYGLVIGTSLSDPEAKALSDRIASLGIAGDVAVYNGWIDDVLKRKLLCGADVIALPSLYEPFGIVTLEGLAADLACERNNVRGPVVVVGDTGGMSEIIRNGVNGFKVPMAEDKFDMPPHYLAKILRMALTDEGLSQRVSRGGSQRVQSQYFNWDYIALRMQDVHAKAIENYNRWYVK